MGSGLRRFGFRFEVARFVVARFVVVPAARVGRVGVVGLTPALWPLSPPS